jgi:hypothetical protein
MVRSALLGQPVFVSELEVLEAIRVAKLRIDEVDVLIVCITLLLGVAQVDGLEMIDFI